MKIQRKVKKLIGLVLGLVMAIGLAVPVMAAEDEFEIGLLSSVTISVPDSRAILDGDVFVERIEFDSVMTLTNIGDIVVLRHEEHLKARSIINIFYFFPGASITPQADIHLYTFDGWSFEDVKYFLWAYATVDADYFAIRETWLPRGARGNQPHPPVADGPDSYIVIVAGGPGKHSVYFETTRYVPVIKVIGD